MDWLEALILGLIQGLTEYLPVSSSGHLAIGAKLFGLSGEENLAFTVAVHVATVLSTLVILWKEIVWLFKGFFKFKWNDEMKYVVNILISMIPVAIVGFLFKDTVEEIFGSGLLVVGICLLVTAALLAFAYSAWQQEGKVGSVLVPYGDSSYPWRSIAGCAENGKGKCRCSDEFYWIFAIGSGFYHGFCGWMPRLQVDDKHSEEGQTDMVCCVLRHRRPCIHNFPQLNGIFLVRQVAGF